MSPKDNAGLSFAEWNSTPQLCILVYILDLLVSALFRIKKRKPVMPQISLYIDKETLEKVERAADSEKLSISKWVGKQVKKSLQADYPQNFQDLFGSVRDETFTVPGRESSDMDAKRVSF